VTSDKWHVIHHGGFVLRRTSEERGRQWHEFSIMCPPMANPQIDEFIQALFWKAGLWIVLGSIAGLLIREGLQWLERRATRFGQERRKNRRAESAVAAVEGKRAKSETPHCPVCNAAMVKRVKRGARAGAAFWGCTSYPNCLGTRDA
jgi:hypothetical protein